MVLPALAARPPGAIDHALAVVRRTPADPALRFAALLHVLGAQEAERILVALRQPRRVSDEVAALVRAHACRYAAPEPLPASPVEVRRWLSRVGVARRDAQLALAAAEAAALPARGARARADVRRLAAVVAAQQAASHPLSAQELALDGRAIMAILGAGPGPHVGEALRHLLERVLEHPALNTPDALAEELRAWWPTRRRRL